MTNKYKKIYYNIISKATDRQQLKDLYYEKHHIIPKSLGGSNENSNLVKLSGREHFICHLLLWKMHSIGSIERQKMAYALNQMKRLANKNINSKLYENLKKEHSKNVSDSKRGNSYCSGMGKTLTNIKTGERKRFKKSEIVSTDWIYIKTVVKNNLFYYDPLTDKEFRFSVDTKIPSHLIKGRSNKFKQSVGKSSVGNVSNKNRIKIHNPDTNESLSIKRGDIIPENFIYGISNEYKMKISNSSKGRKANNKGKFRYHNPVTGETKQLNPNDIVPDGFIRGMHPSFSQKVKNGMKKS